MEAFVRFSPILNDLTGFGLVMRRFGNWSALGCGCKLHQDRSRGHFGRNAQCWAYRVLDEGCVHILAMDAHDTDRRPPDLSRGRDAAAARVGIKEAEHLVLTRPLGVIENEAPANLPRPAASRGGAKLGGGYVEADFPDADIETKELAERTSGRPSRRTHTYLRKFVGRLRQLAESERW